MVDTSLLSSDKSKDQAVDQQAANPFIRRMMLRVQARALQGASTLSNLLDLLRGETLSNVDLAEITRMAQDLGGNTESEQEGLEAKAFWLRL